MPSINSLGICSTCKHGSNCELLATARLDTSGVVQCEQFEMENWRPAAPPGVDRNNPGHGVEDAAGPAGLLGLCRSCAGRADCQFPKPDAGVWHCEEYR